jgi:hypothetical protein
MRLPNGSAVVLARVVVQTVVDQPVVVNQPALLEPIPRFQRLVEVILRRISGSTGQMCGRVDVEFVGDGVDVSVRFVPPQAATGRCVVSLVHVVENDLRGVEVFLVAGYVVCCDPVGSIYVRRSFVRRLSILSLGKYSTYQAKTHHPSSS